MVEAERSLPGGCRSGGRQSIRTGREDWFVQVAAHMFPDIRPSAQFNFLRAISLVLLWVFPRIRSLRIERYRHLLEPRMGYCIWRIEFHLLASSYRWSED